jgi:hypothetical protein
MEKALPVKPVINYTNINNNLNNNVLNNSVSIIQNIDKEDLEIKRLINKANELSQNSILNNKNNVIEKKEPKTFEDKYCQSDDEIENEYNNQKNAENKKEENDNNSQEEYSNNKNENRYPYDPYKHLGYYNDLKNNNNNNINIDNNNNENNNNNEKDNNISYSYTRVKKMEDLYNRSPNSPKRQPIIYIQPESKNNIANNIRINNQSMINLANNNNEDNNNSNGKRNFTWNNFNNNNNNKNDNNNYQRFRPSNITQAMDILLDKD